MSRRNRVVVAAVLAMLVVAVYAPVRQFDFVQLDDPAYVTENPLVLRGVTLPGLTWAFTTGHSANWHPLTWLSHMIDVQLFGVAPGPHHVTSLLLHVANTLLLFGLLVRLTGAIWRSAFVAALFGVHPLHVESVAWVAERKDVLSTFFWMLTMWAYVAWARSATPSAIVNAAAGDTGLKSRAARVGGGETAGVARRRVYYALLLVCFALGLMAKPMLVTLPFVLLLLDLWPLERLQLATQFPASRKAGGNAAHAAAKPPKTSRASRRAGRRRADAGRGEARDVLRAAWPLVREKIPLFLMAASSSAITLVVQQRGGAVTAIEAGSFGLRLQNALVSVVAYLRGMVWPADLTVIYPFPDSVPAWSVVVACFVLGGVSIAVLRLARRHPYLPVGWLWYLGTLVPVLGLVQVGVQARADRYTYVPLIGVFIMVAWGSASIATRTRALRLAVAIAAAVSVLACSVVARVQVGYWRDNVSLWTRATMLTLRVDEFEAHVSVGTTLGNQQRLDEAASHFGEAVRLRPSSDVAHYNLGLALARLGRTGEAERALGEALRLNPGNEAARRALEALPRRDGTDRTPR